MEAGCPPSDIKRPTIGVVAKDTAGVRDGVYFQRRMQEVIVRLESLIAEYDPGQLNGEQITEDGSYTS